VAPVAELIGNHGEFVLEFPDPNPPLELVRGQDWGRSARLEDGMLVAASPSGRGRDLVHFLAQADLWPETIDERQQNLEEVFLRLTGTGR
jgi:hypothetical protein